MPKWEPGTNEAYLAGVPLYSRRGHVQVPLSVPITTLRHALLRAGFPEWERGHEGFVLAAAGADDVNPDNIEVWLTLGLPSDSEVMNESFERRPTEVTTPKLKTNGKPAKIGRL